VTTGHAGAPGGPAAGAAAVAVAACATARPLVLLLDIDGTLAPIVPRPEEARVPGATLATLGALAALPDTQLAFVTGRAPADARALAPVPGAWVVGNHGAERLAPDGAHLIDPAVAAFGPALRAAAAALAPVVAAVPGAWVEDKAWSLSVHLRQAAPTDAPHVAAAARAAAAHHGLRASDGKQVVELRAPVAVDKGTAGVALARTLGADAPGAAALAVGDDVTDEDLFRRARAELPRAVTVRVGDAGVATAAELRVDDPPAVAALLAALLAARAGP
jgi:trehalose 6-phosphate phosphatase